MLRRGDIDSQGVLVYETYLAEPFPNVTFTVIKLVMIPNLF